jgi:hypothetical protein
MAVVRATAQHNVLYRGRASDSKRHHMMELDEAAFGAPAARTAERAPAIVTPPYLATHGCRDVQSASSSFLKLLPVGARTEGELLSKTCQELSQPIRIFLRVQSSRDES